MELTLIGLSHRTAPVEVREKLAFDADSAASALQSLSALDHVREATLLSTCNRTELVIANRIGTPLYHDVIRFLSELRDVDLKTVDGVTYHYTGRNAVRHIFRVAASLDSLVVGEPQITGQVKDAYRIACEAGVCGPMLHRLYHRTFQVAKRIRNETRIAENAVSVSYAGVELARRIFGSLNARQALLVGAGEMAELALQHLQSAGLGRVSIANRTAARAAALATQFGGYAVGWEEIEPQLVNADIVISSAAAPHFVIRRETLAPVLRKRKYRPLFLIDLGVPRNIDPAVGELEGCYVYDIDDLESVVEENLASRHEEAAKAETIIEDESEKFFAFLNSLQVVPTILALKSRFEEVRRTELEKTLSTLDGLNKKDRERIDYLTAALVKKLLHDPITALKAAEREGLGEQAIHLTRRLFGIEETAAEALALRLAAEAGGSDTDEE